MNRSGFDALLGKIREKDDLRLFDDLNSLQGSNGYYIGQFAFVSDIGDGTPGIYWWNGTERKALIDGNDDPAIHETLITETRIKTVPLYSQYIVADEMIIEGTLNLDGTLVIL